jgi:hypothetical protein
MLVFGQYQLRNSLTVLNAQNRWFLFWNCNFVKIKRVFFDMLARPAPIKELREETFHIEPSLVASLEAL